MPYCLWKSPFGLQEEPCKLFRTNHYNELMIAKLEELDEVRLSALDCLVVQKNWAARAYNKRVKVKLFCVGGLVWKTIQPIDDKSL